MENLKKIKVRIKNDEEFKKIQKKYLKKMVLGKAEKNIY